MLHVLRLVHPDGDLDAQVVGEVLGPDHGVPLGVAGAAGGGVDDDLAQLLVLQAQHARALRVQLHLHAGQRVRGGEVPLRVPPVNSHPTPSLIPFHFLVNFLS